MASGFFLGGLGQGINNATDQIALAQRQQQLMQVEGARLAQDQKNQQRNFYLKLREQAINDLGSTVGALKDHNPGWTDAQIMSNQAVSHQVDQLSNFDKNLGLDPKDAQSIVAGIVARPGEIQTARMKAEATGTYGKEQAQTKEANARAGYLNRGGLPATDNPDLDVDTQLGGNPNTRVAQGFGALETGASPSPAAKATNAGSTILNNLAKQSGLLPEALDAAGRAWAGGNTSVLSNFGRGRQGAAQLAAIKQWGLYSLAHDNKLTPQQAADQLNFNTQNFAGQKAAQTTIGRRSGNMALAGSEFEQVSQLVIDASNNVPRTQYKSINDIMNAWREGTGDPNIVQLGAAINSAVNVYSRAISPTGTPTVSDKDHAREILQTGWSNGQVAAAIAQLNKEVAAAKKSIPAAQQTLRGQSGEGAGVTVHGFTFTPTGQ